MRSDQRRKHAALRHPSRYFHGCEGKRKYPSKKSALGMLRTLLYQAYDGYRPDKYGGWTQQEYIAFVKTEQPYRCVFCKSWHIGHSNREVVVR